MKIKVKKEDINKFDKSSIGQRKNAYLKRSTIMGILLVMFGFSWILLNIYNNIENAFELATAILCILIGLFFIINSKIIKLKEVNKYIYNNKSPKK
ncbi:MAG: hypothetical protein IJ572_05390 [Bacilli bacterium]|nr:hypothetical protein [Bacilli bacterium]